jgi:hypothetical protein
MEPLITKHILIIEHFLTFFLFLYEIQWFLCHWTCKLEVTNFLWATKKNTRRGWVIFCFKNFQKKSRYLPSSNLLYSSFLVHFWVAKNSMGAPTRALQILFYSINKDTMIKDFKLKIIIYFNSHHLSSNTEL